MFNTICHQGNSNYDSNRILLHTHYFITLKTCHHKTLKTMWSNGNCHILLVGVQNVTRSLENSLVVFYKITSTPTLWPSNSTLMLASFLAVKVKVAQSCPTLWDPMDYTVHGILQARILEWIAMPSSKGFSQPRDQTQVSRIAWRFFTNWATREALADICLSLNHSHHSDWVDQGLRPTFRAWQWGQSY